MPTFLLSGPNGHSPAECVDGETAFTLLLMTQASRFKPTVLNQES